MHTEKETSFLSFSHSVLYDSFRPHGLQQVRFFCPSPSPKVCSNSCPLSRWCYTTFPSSAIPFSSCLSLSQHQGLFWWVGSSHQVAKALDLQLEHQSFQWIFILRVDFLQDWLVWSLCSPRDSHESSPTPQFKSIKSLAFRLLYSPTLNSHTWPQEKP